jgi:hypothetical protein
MAVMLLTNAAAWSGAAGIVRTYSVEDYFLVNDLAMDRYFNYETIMKQQDDLGSPAGIYEYDTKSPGKAFLLSLAVPGAGEYYTGHKFKAAAFLAVDALLWTGYFVYHKKGSDKEGEYETFANRHYDPIVFLQWWNDLDSLTQSQYSHRLPVDENGNPIFNHEYYENIGKYDQFQVGWEDIGPNFPPEDTSAVWGYRVTYLDMRKQANDYFSNATTAVMVSIANHIVSAFDAAIGAKRYNRGSRQYSLNLKTKNIDGRTTPFLTLTKKF